MIKRRRNGQALVEWAILGSIILIFWAYSLQAAKRILARTAAESWGMLAARQSLSKATILAPAGMEVRSAKGRSRVALDGTAVHSTIVVPVPKLGFWSSILPSFGPLFSLFSE